MNNMDYMFILVIEPDHWSLVKQSEREKGRGLTQSYDKSPYTHRKIQKATWQQKTATKNFDYTTIANRLRTVSWSSNSTSHPTGVVKPVEDWNVMP